MSAHPEPPIGQHCARPDPARHKALGAHSRPLELHREFTPAQFEILKLGLTPQQMEDHWYIYFDPARQQLVFHRSWTSYCIFVAQLAGNAAGGCQLLHAWANSDENQFRCPDPDEAGRLLLSLFDMLLHRP